MKSPSWTTWISKRWFSARKENGGAASSKLASAGIGVGVAALVVVLAVMNGFQLGYIESILAISSYHARVTGGASSRGSLVPDAALVSALEKEEGVACVVPFLETQVLAGGDSGRTTPLKLRALPADIGSRDPGFVSALALEDGRPGRAADFFGPEGGVVIGSELARSLNLGVGDSLSALALTTDKEEGIATTALSLRVSAVFHSGYYDFDSSLAFIDFGTAAALYPAGKEAGFTYGIKLRNRDRDGLFVSRLKPREAGLGITGIEGWRDYNRSFFGALRTEKTLMMILVGLIFVVVGVNIYQSMRRNVFERMEELALIKALGGKGEELKRIFVVDGFAIGAIGSLIGLACGLFIAVNVNEILSLAAALLNGAASFFARLGGMAPGGAGGGGDFSVFSPRYFYLMEVPVRILFPETFFIVAAAIASSGLAAAVATSEVAELEPSELLRYE
jgi:lipoprotein-releasing system permease protein